MENLWKTYGINMGKPMEWKTWKTHGKPMENMDKPMETYGDMEILW